MATLAVGAVVSVYCPLSGTMTVTPGTSGRVSINARGRDGSQSLAPRELYTAETLTVNAGDTVGLEAINAAATYTDPAAESAALQALVSEDGEGNPGPATSFFSATGGLWSGLVADGVPAPWAVAINAPLTASLEPDYGGYPTFARDADYTTLPMVTDDEGMLRDTLLGEAMFHGARRERQLCRYTERMDFTGSNGWSVVNSLTVAPVWDYTAPAPSGIGVEPGTVWKLTAAASVGSSLQSQSGYVLAPVPHVFALKMRADTPVTAEIRLRITGGATLQTKSVAVTTAWQWFYVTGTPDGTSSYSYQIAPTGLASGAAGVVYVCHPQLHERLGATSAPPAYTPRDSQPRTRYWEGAAVDGVAYFDTLNANTLNAGAGVVTAVAGGSLADVDGVPADLTGWTPSGAAAEVSGDWYLIREDTTTGAHHVNTSAPSSAAYDKRRMLFEAEVKQVDGANRAWVRMFVQDIDGSTGRSAYFNIATGAIGTVSAGLMPVVEALTDSSGSPAGGYRVGVSMQLGTGASNAVIRIYSITADNTATHTGDITKGILVRNVRTVLRTCRGIDLFPTFSQLLDTRFSTWGLTGGTLATGITGPDGRAGAVKFTEDTSTGAHHINASLIGSAAYGGKFVTLSVYAKQAGGSDRAWCRVYLQDIDAIPTAYSVYFNLTTGQIGTTSAGVYPEVEAVGDGWYRLMVAIPLGTGVSNAVARFYSATADNTPTHTGTTANGILLFLPNATSAITSGSSDNKAVGFPPVPNGTVSAIVVPGSHLSWPVSGVLGRTDFGLSLAYTPYYKPSRRYKGGNSAQYSAVAYIRCEAPPNTISTFDDYDTCRTGLTLRPNQQGTTHYAKRAFDLYCGNPNGLFFWRPLTAYAVGDIVLRLDTAPNNDNGRKVYTCVVAGTSGASEPAWVSTFTAVPDTTSNLTTDGTVRWQVNENNGIDGNWEPYLGAQLVAPHDTFMAELRDAFWITSTDYSCYTNDVEYVKQTARNLENGMPTVLPYRPKYLWLGQFGGNSGVPGAKAAGTADAALMSSWRSFCRDLVVWHTAPTAAVIRATSELA